MQNLKDLPSAKAQLEQQLKWGKIEFMATSILYMLAREIDKLREEIEQIKSK